MAVSPIPSGKAGVLLGLGGPRQLPDLSEPTREPWGAIKVRTKPALHEDKGDTRAWMWQVSCVEGGAAVGPQHSAGNVSHARQGWLALGAFGRWEREHMGLRVDDLSWGLPSLSEDRVKEQGHVSMAGRFKCCKC